jgi:hypothetical protein
LAKESLAMGHKTPAMKAFYEAGNQGGYRAGLAAAEQAR